MWPSLDAALLRRGAVVALAAGAAVALVAVARALAIPRRRRPGASATDVGAALGADTVAPYAVRVDEIAAHLSAAIRLRTISYDPPDALDAAAPARAACGCGAAGGTPLGPAPSSAATRETRVELLKFHALLRGAYPQLHARTDVHVINELSLVFVWRGSDAALPATALYAHLDVVPAPDASSWVSPPFDGAIVDGHVVGRGAIDDKQAVIGICEAVERLLTTGFTPRRTVVVIFGHDEEIGGYDGAQHAYRWVAANLARGPAGAGRPPLAFLLDEGLFVVHGAVRGIPPTLRTALICTEEKGFVTVRLGVTGVRGGHASVPPRDTAAGILSRAVAALEASPFPASFGRVRAVSAMMSALLPHFESFALRLVFANASWLTAPLVARALAAAPSSAALVRTTTAATVMRVGSKSNTLAPDGFAMVNHRILPGESVASVLARDAAVINDPRVTLTPVDPVEPSPASDAGSPAFRVVARAVEAACAGAVAVPALMVGATDSRWAWGHAAQILRHSPTELHASEVGMFHGVNERISLPNIARACAFYELVLRGADAAALDGDDGLPLALGASAT